MWDAFLRLLAAARRPLVVLDFETAGLSGAPPCEFAVLVFAPWEPQDGDETTRKAAAACPPGLTYALAKRLNPLQPIDPDATRVHGIRDEDVRGEQPYNDLELRAFFQGLAAGDEGWTGGGEGDAVGPAVFVGHNIASADAPWARKWGYLPPAEVDMVDTIRVVRRLQRTYPRPLAVDLLGGYGATGMPCIEWGLDVFGASLAGSHVALLGHRPAEEHGALADCCATARVLARLLDAWGPCWPPLISTVPATANLAALLAALGAPEPGMVSWDGWLGEAPSGGFLWRKGKHKGAAVDCDPGYRRWVCDLPRMPSGNDGEAWCSQHTADILAVQRPVAVVR
jgi:DNA polymerase III epsilon subunit-like protein